MTEPIIELSGLTKRYDEHLAVDNLTLTVNRGEIFGLLGPNGAGKSTTILMMLGLSEPSGGMARVCGIDATREPIQVKKRVGYLPDDVGFYEDRSGLENLVYTAMLNRVPADEARARAERLLERVGLSAAAHRKTGAYSRGMRQRLGLADVLIKQPEVIILDEPTLGIDPEGVRELLELIHRLSRDEGLTVLLSSHHLHQVQQICDRVGLFVAGRLLAAGDVESLSAALFVEEPILVEATIGAATDSLLARLRTVAGVTRIERAGNGRPPAMPEAAAMDDVAFDPGKRVTEMPEGKAPDMDARNAASGGAAASLMQLHVYGNRDMTAELAREIVAGGAELHALNKKQYGLDEIYHRYFEGRGGA